MAAAPVSALQGFAAGAGDMTFQLATRYRVRLPARRDRKEEGGCVLALCHQARRWIEEAEPWAARRLFAK